MDGHLSECLNENTLNFKRALDRIAEKYSKLKYQDGGIEVDLGNIQWASLDNYMDLSKKKLNSLESKNLADLNEESLNGQDVLGNSQLDHSYDSGADRTFASTRGLAVEDTKVMSLLDESCRTLSEKELLPEDEDEELQMSLNSNGSSLSLVELYPSMVSRIERAWHRQHVSDAASSVLKRYRRFRQQPKRSSLNSTFDVTRRHTNRNPKTNKVLHKESSCSSVKRTRPEVTPESVQQSTVTSLRDGQVQQQSPGKDRAFLRREVPHTVRVMNFFKTAKPREISLNKTFVVSELPRRKLQLGEQVSSNTVSPSRLSYLTVMDSSFSEKWSFISSASTESVTCAKEAPALKERPNIYGSPVRQSPFKAQMTNLSRSPHAFLRSPQRCSVDHSFTELVTSRSLSMSQPSTPSRSVVQQRALHPPRSHHSSQQQLRLPQSAQRAAAHPSLRRHLSFDSSLPPTVSPKKVDEDFIQLYHKFVCKNKSAFFNSLPCRLCARSSEGSKGHSSSSSSLAALALSPHRAVLWKRHRELEGDSYPQSKRLRDECHTFSPGSKRHKNKMLKRCLSPSELEPPHGASSFSPSKHRLQEPAARQEAWMRRCQAVSAADFSSLGDSCERKMPSGYSPRSWQ